MGHTVGDQANRAVKKGERKQVLETRSPDEIIKAIRGNLAAHLAVTPNDVQFLLAQYDAAVHIIEDRATEVRDLQIKLDEFRSVYEQENRST